MPESGNSYALTSLHLLISNFNRKSTFTLHGVVRLQ